MIFEPADRRRRANTVADVIELDDQYLFYGAPVEQRVTGAHHFHRLTVQNHVVELFRKSWMMIGIAVPEGVAPSVLEHRGIVPLVGRAAAGALVVNQNRVRREDAEKPLRPDFETIVEVVVDDLVRL